MATYKISGALHFHLEPVNVLALEKDGVFDIHTGNQAQSFIWSASNRGETEARFLTLFCPD